MGDFEVDFDFSEGGMLSSDVYSSSPSIPSTDFTADFSLDIADLSEGELSSWLALVQDHASFESPKKKKKRIRKKNYFPLPRVLRIDIRRKYPVMLLNVINSFDPDLMCNFFKRFCVPDCRMSDNVLHPLTRVKTEMFVRAGLAEMLKFAHDKVPADEEAPDFVMQLHQACIKQSNMYEGSKILLQLSAKGSSMFSFFESIGIRCPDKLAVMKDVLAGLEKKYNMKYSSFEQCGFIGNMTISLDKERRFENFEMDVDFFLADALK